MRRVFSSLIVSLLAVLGMLAGFTGVAQAVDVLQPGCQAGAGTQFCKNVNENKSTDRILGPEGLVTQITQTIIYITGAISVIMIVIGGLKYVFSAGDSAGVQSAKNTILYAIIGLVVTLFAQVIVSFVLSKL